VGEGRCRRGDGAIGYLVKRVETNMDTVAME
jgi:hypothetical protein